MKARRFLAVVLAVTLLLLGVAGAAWWLVWQRSPLQLQQRPLPPPRSARFVPRDAALSFYLLSDAEQPLAYARAVAPARQRRQAAEAVARLRDGTFAAAGLDYAGELAGWLGPETGLWVLADQGGDPGGWVLALSSRDNDGARRFLQRFWQTRSLAGTELQISSYRGMGVISGRGALLGRQPVPLATALIDDDLVLLASGRGALEQALDVSQIDALNQAADPQLQRRLELLGRGMALLVARPEALPTWLGGGGVLPLPAEGLVAALRPQGRELVLDGWLDSGPAPAPDQAPRPLAGNDGQALLAALQGEAAQLALLQDPALWPEPWQPLLQTLLGPQAGPDATPLPALLLGLAQGPVLWRQDGGGWLLGSRPEQPASDALVERLQAQGLAASPLELEGQSVQVWTRLRAAPGSQRRRAGAGEQLAVTLAAARAEQGGWAWWSDSLEALAEQQHGHHQPPALVQRLDNLALPQAALQWAASGEPAQDLLRRWSGWRLLAAMAGQDFSEPVGAVALAVQPDGEGMRWRARIAYDS
jgi:hypothetical protein